MRICRLLVLCSFLLCALAADAQSAPEIFVPQMDGWRVHLGDDPGWASPDFDDSAWTTTDLDRSRFPRELTNGRSRWFRKRIHLPDQRGPLQLLVTTYDGSYELYVDGRRVSPPIQSSLRWRGPVARIFPLRRASDPGGRDIEIAVRSHFYNQPFWAWGALSSVGMGSPEVAANFKTAFEGRKLGDYAVLIAIDSLMVVAGLLVLTLFLQQRGRREYLWLGLFVVCLGSSGGFYALQPFIPISWNGLLGDPSEYWGFAAGFEFVYAFIGRKPHRAARIYIWALFAAPFLINPLAWSGKIQPVAYSWLENGVVLPALVVPVAMLVVWALRGNREAALLIGPMFLANLGSFLVDIEVAVEYLHPSWHGFPSLQLGLVAIGYQAVVQAIFLLAVGLVIFLRFLGVSREQVRTQSELAAARAVQQVLIPSALPSVSGFRIDSVYHPAQQVGGDFFQIIPLSGGSVLAVVGDVSGKGMPAALTVALIVGTLRTLVEITSSPAEILTGLNRRLEGRSTGFTTCVAVCIQPSGEAILASAGHLNPYISSAGAAPREIATTASLPLGLTANAEYTDVPLVLEPGETITFLSDGVVEARNEGGELFGFDRTRAISNQSAEQIANAAQAFGQEDDITVLTLTFAPAEVLHA
jgi:phosphoserine phosphatase RsbU/P